MFARSIKKTHTRCHVLPDLQKSCLQNHFSWRTRRTHINAAHVHGELERLWQTWDEEHPKFSILLTSCHLSLTQTAQFSFMTGLGLLRRYSVRGYSVHLPHLSLAKATTSR